jgi:hypothetical protein
MSKTKEWYMREHWDENALSDKMLYDNTFKV